MGIISAIIFVAIFVIVFAARGGTSTASTSTVNSADNFSFNVGEDTAKRMLNFVDDFMGNQNVEFLNSSPLVKDETTFFATFTIRALLLCAIGRGKNAEAFEDGFMTAVRRRNSLQFITMISDRGEIYDKILASYDSIPDGLDDVFEKFQLLIKYDIAVEKYAPNPESLPLPLLGPITDFSVRQETLLFQRLLSETMYPVFCRLGQIFH